MDIRLKGRWTALKRPKRSSADTAQPVIYLTAHSDESPWKGRSSPAIRLHPQAFRGTGAVNHHRDGALQAPVGQQLREQREWLRVTLTSIGDAVITCDTDGLVTFLNPVAEALTGWSIEEARERPIGEVFRLINEQTRQPSEGTVALVLREGRAKALANHTALVTRDGREIPIEDSAAPIMDADGRVIGVVLVFHDVTEKRRAEEALLQAKEVAKAATQAKTLFLANMSHELRTPMTGVLGMLDIALGQPRSQAAGIYRNSPNVGPLSGPDTQRHPRHDKNRDG